MLRVDDRIAQPADLEVPVLGLLSGEDAVHPRGKLTLGAHATAQTSGSVFGQKVIVAGRRLERFDSQYDHHPL